MVHAGRGDQAGEVTAVASAKSVMTSPDRVHITARWLAEAGEQVIQDEHVQNAHSQAPPVGAVLASHAVHGCVGTKAGEEPLAVGDRAEAEQILIACLLDGRPGSRGSRLRLRRMIAPRTPGQGDRPVDRS